MQLSVHIHHTYFEDNVPEQQHQNALPVQTFTDLMQGQQGQVIRSDSPSLPFAADFDFNQIFNIENIPGLSVSKGIASHPVLKTHG